MSSWQPNLKAALDMLNILELQLRLDWVTYRPSLSHWAAGPGRPSLEVLDSQPSELEGSA